MPAFLRLRQFAHAIAFLAAILALVPAAFAQQVQGEVSQRASSPARERARSAMTGLMVGELSPSATIEPGSSGSSDGLWANPENAGLEIEGLITYESRINGSTGESSFSAERIMNYRTSSSGFLRLQLWATKAYPVYGVRSRSTTSDSSI